MSETATAEAPAPTLDKFIDELSCNYARGHVDALVKIRAGLYADNRQKHPIDYRYVMIAIQKMLEDTYENFPQFTERLDGSIEQMTRRLVKEGVLAGNEDFSKVPTGTVT
jgi:hypothetical protein